MRTYICQLGFDNCLLRIDNSIVNFELTIIDWESTIVDCQVIIPKWSFGNRQLHNCHLRFDICQLGMDNFRISNANRDVSIGNRQLLIVNQQFQNNRFVYSKSTIKKLSSAIRYLSIRNRQVQNCESRFVDCAKWLTFLDCDNRHLQNWQLAIGNRQFNDCRLQIDICRLGIRNCLLDTYVILYSYLHWNKWIKK